MSHGKEPCEDCGIYHMHVRLHMDEDGLPYSDQQTRPQDRWVEFAGVDESGRALWVDAEEATP